jgi:hypothetical protein
VNFDIDRQEIFLEKRADMENHSNSMVGGMDFGICKKMFEADQKTIEFDILKALMPNPKTGQIESAVLGGTGLKNSDPDGPKNETP